LMIAKRTIVLVIASTLVLKSLLAAEPETPPPLRGIVWITDPSFPGIKKACIQISGGGEPLLSEGERQGDISVEEILPDAGKVVIKDHTSQKIKELRFPDAAAGQRDSATFQLRSIS